MKKLEPYYLLFFSALLWFVSSLFYLFNDDHAMDVNIQDTYYVIAMLHFNLLIGTTLLVLGILYVVFEKWLFQLNKQLSWIHIGFTVLSALLLFISISYFSGLQGLSKRYYTNSSFPDDNTLIVLSLMVLGLIQIVFIINIAISFFRNRVKPTP